MGAENADTSDSSKKRVDRGKVILGNLTDKNVGQLKAVCGAVFPVSYSDRFYADLLLQPELSKLAFVADDLLVGVCSCKLEKVEPAGDRESWRVYVYTLGALAAYRRLGVGTALLEWVLDEVVTKQGKHVTQVYVHVQAGNDSALAFYEKFGFNRTGELKNYYKRIEPADCIIMTKTIK